MTLRQTITASLVAITALIYSLLIEPQWIEVTRHSKDIGLGAGEITIAQVSDLHTSSLGRAEKNTLTALREVRPDVIVITGDAIDERGSLPALDSFLKQLPAAVKIATLGNWEYWAEVDLEELRDVYSKNGVTLLVNDCMTVRAKGAVINVIGLDDYTAGRPDLSLAVGRCEVERPIVVATHSPGLFDEAPPVPGKPVSLLLAGHTHGGQLAFGKQALYTPRGSGSFVAGWYQTQWGDLYVSRGVGTSVLPMRLGARPELPVITTK
jgi:predicted MPP superfamily phosphohydrolase